MHAECSLVTKVQTLHGFDMRSAAEKQAASNQATVWETQTNTEWVWVTALWRAILRYYMIHIIYYLRLKISSFLQVQCDVGLNGLHQHVTTHSARLQRRVNAFVFELLMKQATVALRHFDSEIRFMGLLWRLKNLRFVCSSCMASETFLKLEYPRRWRRAKGRAACIRSSYTSSEICGLWTSMDTVFSKVLDLRGRFHVHVYPVQILASWDIGHPTCPVTVQPNLFITVQPKTT